uniref:Uncharacterized protein n=1 Tax=Calcidiscus leptoporus TaxID=127549 RepID=A0A7S0IS51_9EUKA|mmetsp:Transcript_2/g.15  ORF Transcript_2/g.15 Transcript_2/m.15 type:complete len:111 (+) Transcript_2:564-896(+)
MPPTAQSSGNGDGARTPPSSPPRRCAQRLSRWIEGKRRSRVAPVSVGAEAVKNLVSTRDVKPQSRSEVETSGEKGTYSVIVMLFPRWNAMWRPFRRKRVALIRKRKFKLV